LSEVLHHFVVVGGHEDRGARRVYPKEELKNLGRNVRVEVSSGLVGEEDFRTVDDGARNGHTLLLATVEFEGAVLTFVVQTHLSENLHDALLDVIVPTSGHPHGHGDVFENVTVLEELEVLEDDSNLPA